MIYSITRLQYADFALALTFPHESFHFSKVLPIFHNYFNLLTEPHRTQTNKLQQIEDRERKIEAIKLHCPNTICITAVYSHLSGP